jgi:hypothetical protein
MNNEFEENIVKPLKLYEEYSRQQVQQIFDPEATFISGAGLLSTREINLDLSRIWGNRFDFTQGSAR